MNLFIKNSKNTKEQLVIYKNKLEPIIACNSNKREKAWMWVVVGAWRRRKRGHGSDGLGWGSENKPGSWCCSGSWGEDKAEKKCRA